MVTRKIAFNQWRNNMLCRFKKLKTKLEESTKLSNEWFYNFMSGWPKLKLVKPQQLSKHRTNSTSQEKMNILKSFQRNMTTIY
jgi:hypothetical protein